MPYFLSHLHLHLLLSVTVGLLLLPASFGYGLGGGSEAGVLALPRSYLRLKREVLSEFSNGGIFGLGTIRPREVRVCPPGPRDGVPCYSGNATVDGPPERRCRSTPGPKCLSRPPKEYRLPLRWPACRDSAWPGNVKIPAVGTGAGTDNRLMLVEEKLITFPPDGTKSYSQKIAKMIGLNSDAEFRQSGVQTVLDVGCGIGSLGAHLFSRNVITLCLAKYEADGSQVQFALERGLPAMIGNFVTKQLPYPSLSFDMVHCADCGVDWSMKDGALLMELDRLLRPGGYFVWTSPLANPSESVLSSEDQKKWKHVEQLAKRMCWDLLSQQEQTVVWKKKNEQSCYLRRGSNTLPSLCDMEVEKDSSLYQPLRSCIVGVPNARWISARQQTLWPNVLALPSSRLLNQGFFSEELTDDLGIWISLIRNYWSLLSPIIFSDHPKRPAEGDPLPPPNMVRNVMDMNAVYGTFNSALLQAGKLVWVMNVVPTSAPNTLPAIFSRGLIGTLHDWCEAFPTYPRTYDLLHGIGLLSQEMERPKSCGLSGLFLEMDRILRPEGWVLLRDKAQLIEDARMAAVQMRWEACIVEVDSDSESRLLVCQKNFWKG